MVTKTTKRFTWLSPSTTPQHTTLLLNVHHPVIVALFTGLLQRTMSRKMLHMQATVTKCFCPCKSASGTTKNKEYTFEILHNWLNNNHIQGKYTYMCLSTKPKPPLQQKKGEYVSAGYINWLFCAKMALSYFYIYNM